MLKQFLESTSTKQ